MSEMPPAVLSRVPCTLSISRSGPPTRDGDSVSKCDFVVRVARRPEHVSGARAEGAGVEGVLVEVTGEVLLPVLLPRIAPLDQEALNLAP